MSSETLETNPFNSLYKTIVFSPDDYSIGKDKVWLYGIIVGWDDESLKEFENRYWWWKKEDTYRLKEMHRQFVALAKENGCDCYEGE